MLGIAASLTSMVAGYSENAGEDLQGRARTLRETALRLADEDAAASKAFGAAFRLDPGPEREQAIRGASVEAAKASAVLGDHAIEAIDDLEWLSTNGNPALIADVVVAFGALRAAIAGARTNVSFDLSALAKDGTTLEEVREAHPDLWETVGRLSEAIDRIDALTADVDNKAAPTDAL